MLLSFAEVFSNHNIVKFVKTTTVRMFVRSLKEKMKEDIMIAGLMDATPGHQPLGYK